MLREKQVPTEMEAGRIPRKRHVANKSDQTEGSRNTEVNKRYKAENEKASLQQEEKEGSRNVENSQIMRCPEAEREGRGHSPLLSGFWAAFQVWFQGACVLATNPGAGVTRASVPHNQKCPTETLTTPTWLIQDGLLERAFLPALQQVVLHNAVPGH